MRWFEQMPERITGFVAAHSGMTEKRYNHSNASEMPPSWSMSFSRTALRPSSTVPTSVSYTHLMLRGMSSA